MEKIIVTTLIVLAIAFVVFLILRELFCWYWKINEGLQINRQQIALLQSIDSSLIKISRSLMTDEEKAKHQEKMQSAIQEAKKNIQ